MVEAVQALIAGVESGYLTERQWMAWSERLASRLARGPL